MRVRTSNLSLALPAAVAVAVAAVAAQESFDYIIVGAGTCGLALANRLSASPSVTVALVDPGADRRSDPAVRDPAQWLRAASSPLLNYNYTSAPQVHAAGQSVPQSAGRGIGGSSLINGMTYIRGDQAQFDAWAEVGDGGWDWGMVLERMKALETFTPPDQWQVDVGASYEPSFHGNGTGGEEGGKEGGELHVGFSPVLQNGTFQDVVQRGWAAVGYAKAADPNGGRTRGFSVWPQTLDAGTNARWDAATAFYWDVVDARENLKLFNGTARRVIWDDDDKLVRARGVEYVGSDNRTRTLHANKEVILSAGSLRTPLILEASGVGDKRLLADLGIDAVVDLPGVGENMVDQPNNNVVYAVSNTTANSSSPPLLDGNGYAPYATFATMRDILSNLTDEAFQAHAAAVEAKLPAWAAGVSEASAGRVSAANVEALYRVQHRLLYEDGVSAAEILTTAVEGKMAFSAFWPLMPFSRGSVHLSRSAGAAGGAAATPVIDPKYYLVDDDLALQTRVARLTTSFYESKPLAGVVDQVAGPPGGAGTTTDEQWGEYLRTGLTGNAHCVSTAAMMRRELGGVVDGRLRVYGTEGLRVVDASVVPMQVSGHLTAMLYAVAQRASEVILDDAAGRV
ncbi:hypothetical protein N3K66_007945 [Trichothecium roseum]|uniref:Uncharacterized protein n=1 Tax=Trichothecium roseum TaxID=47278 RepID=A0ACC0US48_9HYPO|nr:hypothetical protein N3K66_007945 [Trichothecium roseum]